jgi:hypothetical protein
LEGESSVEINDTFYTKLQRELRCPLGGMEISQHMGFQNELACRVYLSSSTPSNSNQPSPRLCFACLLTHQPVQDGQCPNALLVGEVRFETKLKVMVDLMAIIKHTLWKMSVMAPCARSMASHKV